VKPNLARIGLLILGFSPALLGQTFQSGPAATALIELYTSEGCSSCPPAERWLSELKSDKALWTRFVPVAFHVNYWDYLGWPDDYAQAAFTQRQNTYATAWDSRSVYTPEFVYQGQEWKPGLPTPKTTSPGLLILNRNPDGSGTVSYKPDAKTPAKTYEASVAVLGGDVLVKVRAGENAGRTLAHDFVALHVASIILTLSADGTFNGSFAAPPSNLPKAGKHAIAAWISPPGDQLPLQATGGWID